MAQTQNGVTGSPTTGTEHEDSARIRHDIERTRDEMDETIDALEQRLQPRHLMDEIAGMLGTHITKDDVTRVAKNSGSYLADAIKQHPVSTGLLAAGLTYMFFERRVMNSFEKSSSDEDRMYSGSFVDARTGQPYDEEFYGSTEPLGELEAEAYGAMGSEDIEESSLRDKASAKMSKAKYKAKEKMSEAKESLRHGSERAKEKLQHAGERAKEGLSQAGEKIQYGYEYGKIKSSEAIHRYPFAIGAAALGIGALIAMSLPRTRKEDELVGEQADELRKRAKETGRETLERGKEVLEAGAIAAKEEAKEQGLTPEAIKEKAGSVAQEAKHAAEEQARQQDELQDLD